MGALFHAENEELVEGKKGEVPSDPQLVAKGCYVAGFIYMGLFAFCWCQVDGFELEISPGLIC
ncbi:hypothetical protein SpCBS45565_g04219 [Spizellomyces sp. 'palustris']|nr:hypothetical protein SpCBS45565_g04219 [Spizellomyces sp. 'palustris']